MNKTFKMLISLIMLSCVVHAQIELMPICDDVSTAYKFSTLNRTIARTGVILDDALCVDALEIDNPNSFSILVNPLM